MNEHTRTVVYFADTWTNHYRPEVGIAVVKVLEALGYRVIVPPTTCCGRPAVSKGLLRKARRYAAINTRVLAELTHDKTPILFSEPSCMSMLIDEYPQLLRNDTSRAIAKNCLAVEDFVAAELSRRPDALRLRDSEQCVQVHTHCHQKALVGTTGAIALLKHATRGNVSEMNTGCCGMAGSFGHESEHIEVSRRIAEHRLLPAIRSNMHCDVAITGFSCREQIELHTEVRPRHVIEFVADAIISPE